MNPEITQNGVLLNVSVFPEKKTDATNMGLFFYSNLQFLTMQLFLKLGLLFLMHRWPKPILEILYRTFCLLALTILKLFGFPTFQLWTYLMKIIPETCRATKFDIDVLF